MSDYWERQRGESSLLQRIKSKNAWWERYRKWLAECDKMRAVLLDAVIETGLQNSTQFWWWSRPRSSLHVSEWPDRLLSDADSLLKRTQTTEIKKLREYMLWMRREIENTRP